MLRVVSCACYSRANYLSLRDSIGCIAIYKTAIIVLCDKAYLLALCLRCYHHPSLSCQRTYLCLGIRTQRETGMSQLLLVEDMKDIRLILLSVNSTSQPP